MTDREYGLQEKQRRFINEYLLDFDAAAAYRRAGYKATTDNSVSAGSSRLLKSDKIRAIIADRLDALRAKSDITIERVLREFARVAFFDPRKLFDSSGNPKGINDLDGDAVSAIAGFEVVEEFDGRGSEREVVGYIKKYRLADRIRALENLSKYLGLYAPERHEITANIEIKDAREKLTSLIARLASRVETAGSPERN